MGRSGARSRFFLGSQQENRMWLTRAAVVTEKPHVADTRHRGKTKAQHTALTVES